MSAIDRLGSLSRRVAERAQLALGITAVFSTLEALHGRVERLAVTSAPGSGWEAGAGREADAGREAGADTLLYEQIRLLEGRVRANVTQIHALESRLEQVRIGHEALQTGLVEVKQLNKAAHFRPPMWELALQPFREEAAGAVYGFRPGSTERSSREDLHKRLLDVFSGDPAIARDHRRPYLDVIGERSPVVDIGCGRGDFLDLLREQGTNYVGVEPDGGMLAAARARGHSELLETDANSYLEGVPDGSLGALFCAQVVEHMPADYLIRFIELSFAKLKPGGILILEVPNPHSPYTMKIFWVDITHRGPVFPEVALTLCWAYGFSSAYVFHPGGSGDAAADRFTEPEYALVATKGDAEPEAGTG